MLDSEISTVLLRYLRKEASGLRPDVFFNAELFNTAVDVFKEDHAAVPASLRGRTT